MFIFSNCTHHCNLQICKKMANYFRKRFSSFSTLTPFIRSTPVTSDLSKFRCFQGLVLILAKFRTTFRATKNVFLPRIERERASEQRPRSVSSIFGFAWDEIQKRRKKVSYFFLFGNFRFTSRMPWNIFSCVKRNFISAHATVMSAHFKKGC